MSQTLESLVNYFLGCSVGGEGLERCGNFT